MLIDLFTHTPKAHAFYDQALNMVMRYDYLRLFFLKYRLEETKYKPYRQVAAFGIGVLAEKGPKQFDSQIERAVNILVKIVSAKDSQVGRNGNISDNAMSSFAKIMIYRTHIVESQVPNMLDSWINWLPCTHDPTEAKVFLDQIFGSMLMLGLSQDVLGIRQQS